MKTYSELLEATKGKHAVVVFGRMQPPTSGHAKVIEHALSHPGEHHIVASHKQNTSTDPLSGEEKVGILGKMFPQHKKAFSASTSESPSIFHKLAELHEKGHTHVTMVTGADRKEEFQKMLDKYNGQFKVGPDGKKKGYAFKKINVVSAGDRDPDAEGTEGVSGTKMRAAAVSGDYAAFRKGLHHGVNDDDAHALMNKIRTRTKPPKVKKLKEESELVTDKKTGKKYDPKKESDKLFNSPEYIAQMKRMKDEQGKGWPIRKEEVESGFMDEETLQELSLRTYKDVALAINKSATTGKRQSDRKYSNDTKAFKHTANKLFPKDKPATSARFTSDSRNEYIEGNLFKVGDVVVCKEGTAEIVNLGTNYITVLLEGKTIKKWISDVTLVDSTPTAIELPEMFQSLTDHEDKYAVINCVEAYTTLQNIRNLDEDFMKYKSAFDRAVRYFNKFNLDMGALDESEDTLLIHAMMHGIYNFNVLNEAKIDSTAQQIDYKIRDMVNNCLKPANGQIANMRGLEKMNDKLKVSKVAHGLFKKHLKAANPTAHDMIIKGYK